MRRLKKVRRYIRRYEQWKQNVVATSIFVIICGVVAIGYLTYRAVLITTPLATIEQSIFNSRPKTPVICEDSETGVIKHLPLMSTDYQTRLKRLPALGPNIVPNASLSEIDQVTGDPVGYSRSVEDSGIRYEFGQEGSNKTKFLRVISDQQRTPDKVTPAWHMRPVSLAPEPTTYTYSFWYRSTSPVTVSLERTMAGQLNYEGATTLDMSGDWKQFTAHFRSEGASSFRFIATGKGTGRVDIRSFDVHRVADAELSGGLVSVTFDDGWKSIRKQAFPLLRNYNIPTTQYIMSEAAEHKVPGYMTYDEVTTFKNAGHEIGSHSLTHCNQTTLSTDLLQDNAVRAKQSLDARKLGPVTSFSYPHGSYNATTQTTYQKQYPLIRTSDFGYNDRYFDATNIRSIGVMSSTSDTEFRAWLTRVKQQRLWVVLVYHRVDESGEFSVTSSQLERQLKMISESGLTVLPVSSAAASARK